MSEDLDLKGIGSALSKDELNELFNLHDDDVSINTTKHISTEPKSELRKTDTNFSSAFELYNQKVEVIPKLLHPFFFHFEGTNYANLPQLQHLKFFLWKVAMLSVPKHSFHQNPEKDNLQEDHPTRKLKFHFVNFQDHYYDKNPKLLFPSNLSFSGIYSLFNINSIWFAGYFFHSLNVTIPIIYRTYFFFTYVCSFLSEHVANCP